MIEKLEDLRSLGELEKMKKEELVKIIRKATQLVKSEDKKAEQADDVANDFPLYAVSADQSAMYVLKFDPETKEARVVDIIEDTRGSHMHLYKAKAFLVETIGKQVKGAK